nr:inorganic pyrophosphatase 1-like [Tanacetum cinerariifolium]
MLALSNILRPKQAQAARRPRANLAKLHAGHELNQDASPLIDSDNWVVDKLGATDLFNQLLPTMPWNSVMDKMMNELHSQGKSIQDIEEVLKRIPIHPRVVPTIKAAYALGCDLRVLSDANMFYIETILKHYEILECFSEINTNPGSVDEEGKLRIMPYHDFHTFSHGCNLCPPNMCKGKIIERIQATLATQGKKRIVYLGDGAGDFCQSLKLVEDDYMMPRKDFPVWDLICKNRELVKAEVHEWTDGEDLERVLLQLIMTIISIEDENTNQLFDCKFETIGHEMLPKPVYVP